MEAGPGVLESPARGADLEYNLEITFEEAAFGTKKEIELTRMETCPQCNGTGAKSSSGVKTCPVCNGSGEISHTQNTAFGRFVNVTTCNRCHGEGTVIEEPCAKCHGSKKIRRARKSA